MSDVKWFDIRNVFVVVGKVFVVVEKVFVIYRINKRGDIMNGKSNGMNGFNIKDFESFFHAGRDDVYKVMNIAITPDLALILKIAEGRKGGDRKQVMISLSTEELLKLAKICEVVAQKQIEKRISGAFESMGFGQYSNAQSQYPPAQVSMDQVQGGSQMNQGNMNSQMNQGNMSSQMSQGNMNQSQTPRY